MSAAWYALATIAVALVIRWYLENDKNPPGEDAGRVSQRPKGWRGDKP